MNEEEKEEMLKANDFLFELDKSGYKYSCYGREIYIRDNVFRVIDKKDKVIDLMAELLCSIDVISELGCKSWNWNKEQMKEYFYKKVEEENEPK